MRRSTWGAIRPRRRISRISTRSSCVPCCAHWRDDDPDLAGVDVGPRAAACSPGRYRRGGAAAPRDRGPGRTTRAATAPAVARPGDQAPRHAGAVRRAAPRLDAPAGRAAHGVERPDAARRGGQLGQRAEADGRSAGGPGRDAEGRAGRGPRHVGVSHAGATGAVPGDATPVLGPGERDAAGAARAEGRRTRDAAAGWTPAGAGPGAATAAEAGVGLVSR